MRSNSAGAMTAFLMVACLGLAGCGSCDSSEPTRVKSSATSSPEPSSDEGSRVLSFDFDDLPSAETSKALSPGLLRLRNAGSEPFEVHVASLAGGTLLSVPDPDGGRALRFPPYGTKDPRGAVVTASSSSVTDPLAPGTSEFTFGGDFTLDAKSEGGGSDDGNNLIQRGLSDDPAQYKIQIERRLVSCVVAGEDGLVVVKAKRHIVPGTTWYHVSCTRRGDQVILQLGKVGASPEQSLEVGATGAVYVTAETPLVIGGKATASGVVIGSDSDQFNGLVDNVFLEIGEEP